MKTINLKGLNKICYSEQLKNGLEIFMIPYEDKKNYFISFATRYGSDILEWTKNHKNCKPPLGVAHFLEHKMFEQEDGIDPFTFFSESGTDANASTSFDNTQYICSGTKKFNENLRYLLRFVNNPYYTEQNVEKEKGIIAEEIKMYDDIPDFKLEMKLRENIYKNSPRRIDIAGTVEEIEKITKDDLYSCYESFYIPNNMFVLIVGNFNPDTAVAIIKEELEYKEKKELPKIKEIKEIKAVNVKEETIRANIEIPKIAFGLKVPVREIDMDDIELDLYLNMLTTIVFGSSSEFREKARTEKLLNSIYLEWESIPDTKVFYLMASSQKPDILIDKIKEELKNITISEDTFNRLKKVWIANEVKMIDSINATVSNIFDDIVRYGTIIPEKLELIRKMKVETLEKIIKSINFDNISIVKMLNKK